MSRTILCLLIIICHFNLSAQNVKDSLTEKSRPKIGLVLSGGGAKGFSHIGVLKVLEELNMPIDYISGTSMGSIIGALYAMGYSATQIEKLALKQNWRELISDHISRKYIHVKDKAELDRYIISFPIKPKGIEVPIGIIEGQNISNLLEEVTLKFHDKTNFREFPIPFVCIATDLETGQAVVLDKGNIAQALRASMAIPTIFTPTEIDGKLLADGGLINNFPVDEVVKMGADIIIGVDVQTGPKDKKDINSINDIINQTVSLMGKAEFEKNKNLCNIYLKPDIENFSMGDFNKVQELIRLGEKQARIQIKELKNIIDSNQLIQTQVQDHPILSDSTHFFIDQIVINGLKNVRELTFLGKLDIKKQSWISINDIRKGINRAYGSRYFKTINFQINGDKKKTLVINVKERVSNRFNVGLHYDDDNKSSVLLNTTFQNKIKDGPKLSLDLKLSENPRFTAIYNIDNGLKPGFQLKLDINDSKIFTFKDGKKHANYDFKYFNFDANVHSTFQESYSMGIGGRAEIYKVATNFEVPAFENYDGDYYFSYYAFVNMDSHEKGYYPKKGFSLYGEYKLVTNNGLNIHGSKKPMSVAYLKAQKALPLNEKLTLYPKFYGRMVWGTDIPPVFQTYTGGQDQTNYFDIQMPFLGLRRMELRTANTFIFRTDIQFELFKNNYLILKPNIGNIQENANDLFSDKGWIKGIGLTYSYNSLIGPMEITFSTSDVETHLRSFISLGYWF